jgi:hypothetical protein
MGGGDGAKRFEERTVGLAVGSLEARHRVPYVVGGRRVDLGRPGQQAASH